jgi:hypothetical protein
LAALFNSCQKGHFWGKNGKLGGLSPPRDLIPVSCPLNTCLLTWFCIAYFVYLLISCWSAAQQPKRWKSNFSLFSNANCTKSKNKDHFIVQCGYAESESGLRLAARGRLLKSGVFQGCHNF